MTFTIIYISHTMYTCMITTCETTGSGDNCIPVSHRWFSACGKGSSLPGNHNLFPITPQLYTCIKWPAGRACMDWSAGGLAGEGPNDVDNQTAMTTIHLTSSNYVTDIKARCGMCPLKGP